MSLKRCATCGNDYDSFGREIDNTECNKCYSGFKTSKNPVWMVKCQVCKREYDCYGKPQRFTRENISVYSGDPAEPIYECDLCIGTTIAWDEKNSEEDEQEKIKQYIEQHRKEIEKIIITTTDSVPGREIIETFGLVDFTEYPMISLFKSHEPILEIQYQAYEMGANAIIGYASRQEGLKVQHKRHIGTAVRLKDKS
ncbi:hypothetical protein OAQ69_03235 [Gammaproteobacteria bacterium]|nr:hypothetical protein [Gammaproteobacteria bacterium]